MLNAVPAPAAASQSTWRESIAAFKRELLKHALAQTGDNRTRAARALGIERTYLLRLMRELGVTARNHGSRRPGAGTRRS